MQRHYTTSLLVSMCSTKSRADSCASPIQTSTIALPYSNTSNKTVELGERCIVVCCDDKAKVPIGEPGFAVSTGVRGKKTIAPTDTTLVAADHDMTKASVTPSCNS